MSSMWKSSSKSVGGGGSEDGEGAPPSSTKSSSAMDVPSSPQEEEIEIPYNASSPTITQTIPTTPTNPFAATESNTSYPMTSASQEDISAISEAFDFLGGNFDSSTSPTQLLGIYIFVV